MVAWKLLRKISPHSGKENNTDNNKGRPVGLISKLREPKRSWTRRDSRAWSTPCPNADLDLSLQISPAAISHDLWSVNLIICRVFEIGQQYVEFFGFDCWRNWGSLFGCRQSLEKKEKTNFFGILQWFFRSF